VKKLVLLIAVVFLLVGCSPSISIVKDGTLDLDKSVTVGNALDKYKYFYNTKWSVINDEQSRTIVDFVGKLNIEKMFYDANDGHVYAKEWLNKNYKDMRDMEAVHVQFLLNADKKGFKLGYQGLIINGAESHSANVIGDIYANKLIFGGIFTTIILAYEPIRHAEVYREALKAGVNNSVFIGKYDSSSMDIDVKKVTLSSVILTLRINKCGDATNLKQPYAITLEDVEIPLEVGEAQYGHANGDENDRWGLNGVYKTSTDPLEDINIELYLDRGVPTMMIYNKTVSSKGYNSRLSKRWKSDK
jgi:hypothetical protein